MPDTTGNPHWFINKYKDDHPEHSQDLTNAEKRVSTPPPQWMTPQARHEPSILHEVRNALANEWSTSEPNPKSNERMNAAEAITARATPEHTLPNYRQIVTEDTDDLQVEAALSLWSHDPTDVDQSTCQISQMAEDIRIITHKGQTGLTFMDLFDASNPQAANILRQNTSDQDPSGPPPQPQAILEAFSKSSNGLSKRTKFLAANQITDAMSKKLRKETSLRHEQNKGDHLFQDVTNIMDITYEAAKALADGDVDAFARAPTKLLDFKPS